MVCRSRPWREGSWSVGNGLQEKDVALKISKKIKEIAENEYDGVEVRLSQYSDETVSLEERTDLANAWGADYLRLFTLMQAAEPVYESYIYNGVYP